MSSPSLPNIQIEEDNDEVKPMNVLEKSERYLPPPRTAYNTDRRRSTLATSPVIQQESSSEEEEEEEEEEEVVIQPMRPKTSPLHTSPLKPMHSSLMTPKRPIHPSLVTEKPIQPSLITETPIHPSLNTKNDSLAIPMANSNRRRSNLASANYTAEDEEATKTIPYSKKAQSDELLSNRPQPVAIQALKSNSSLEDDKSHQSLKSQSSIRKSSLALAVSRSQSIGDDSYDSNSSSEDQIGTTDKKTMISKSNDVNFGMTIQPPSSTGYKMSDMNPHSYKLMPISKRSRYFLALKYTSLLIHLYNFFCITLTMAFPCFFATIPAFVMNLVADVILLLFLAVMCVTEYDDEFGDAVKDLRLIAKYFLFQKLGLLKIICTIPWDVIPMQSIIYGTSGQCYPTQVEASFSGGNFWSAHRVYALLRLLRFVPLWSGFMSFFHARIPGIPKQMGRLIKNLIFIIFAAHFSACIFFLLSSAQDSKDAFVYSGHIVEDAQGKKVPVFQQYLTSLHYAEGALFFQKRETPLVIEDVYSIIETLIASVIYGSVFGNIFSIIRYMDSTATAQKLEREQKFRTENMKKYMNDKEFPADLHDKVMAHNNWQFMKMKGLDECRVFEGLPKSLQHDIANFLYLNLIKNAPIFKDLDHVFLQHIALNVKPLTVLSGWYVFRAGDEGSEMYFIRSGSVDVCSADGSRVFVTLKKGAFFGEIALLENGRRTASVRATEDTDLCFLTKEDFDAVLYLFPSVNEKITAVANERKERDIKRKQEESRRSVDIFSRTRTVLTKDGIGKKEKSKSNSSLKALEKQMDELRKQEEDEEEEKHRSQEF